MSRSSLLGFKPTLNSFEDRLNLSAVMPTEELFGNFHFVKSAIDIETSVLGAVSTQSKDKLGNFEIQRLMSTSNSSSATPKKHANDKLGNFEIQDLM